MMEIQGIKIYKVKDLEELFGVCEKTMLSYLKSGKLKGRKIGREWVVTEQHLVEFLNGTDDPKGGYSEE